jgi:hypothetical protein
MIPSRPLSLRYSFPRLVDQQWIVIGRCKEFCFMGKGILGQLSQNISMEVEWKESGTKTSVLRKHVA